MWAFGKSVLPFALAWLLCRLLISTLGQLAIGDASDLGWPALADWLLFAVIECLVSVVLFLLALGLLRLLGLPRLFNREADGWLFNFLGAGVLLGAAEGSYFYQEAASGWPWVERGRAFALHAGLETASGIVGCALGSVAAWFVARVTLSRRAARCIVACLQAGLPCAVAGGVLGALLNPCFFPVAAQTPWDRLSISAWALWGMGGGAVSGAGIAVWLLRREWRRDAMAGTEGKASMAGAVEEARVWPPAPREP